jgi:hypothetical protein
VEVGEYWDDAERGLRNYFVEAHLTNIGWFHRLAGRLPRRQRPLYFRKISCGPRLPARSLSPPPERQRTMFRLGISGRLWYRAIAVHFQQNSEDGVYCLQ